MKTICFICEGNICRSPMAEIIFKNLLKKQNIKGFKVLSFGLGAREGEQMTLEAKRALRKIGYNAGNKKSALLKSINKNTLYLTMTKMQKAAFNTENVFTLGQLVGGQDIEDPYLKSQEVYDKTALQIENYCIKLLDKLKNLIKE